MISTAKIVDWGHVQKTGLNEWIKTPEDYARESLRGTITANKLAEDMPVINPTTSEVAGYHYITFRDVHPWAGQFRKGGEVVMAGGFPGAEAIRVEVELEMLQRQMDELLRDAQTDQERMAAAAFYHARFERIHPFNDGNGRVGRVILESQINALFGAKERPTISREEYMAGIRAAQNKPHNLTPLTSLFLRREGLEEIQEELAPKFRIAPFFVSGTEVVRTVEEEIDRSRIESQSIGV